MTSVLSAVPYATKTAGLKRKPTYTEVISHILKDPDKIRYPDRRATISRNSHWLTQSDGFIEAEAQQAEQYHQADQGNMLQEFARQNNLMMAHLLAVVEAMGLQIRRGPMPQEPQGGGGGGGGYAGGGVPDEDMPVPDEDRRWR